MTRGLSEAQSHYDHQTPREYNWCSGCGHTPDSVGEDELCAECRETRGGEPGHCPVCGDANNDGGNGRCMRHAIRESD